MAGDGVVTQHPLKSKTLWASAALAIVSAAKPALVAAAATNPYAGIALAAIFGALRVATKKPLGL